MCLFVTQTPSMECMAAAEAPLQTAVQEVDLSFYPGRPVGCPGGRSSRADERTEAEQVEAAKQGTLGIVDEEGQRVVSVVDDR